MENAFRKHIFRIVEGKRVYPKKDYKELPKRILKFQDPIIYSSVPEDSIAIPVTRNREKQFRDADCVLIIDKLNTVGDLYKPKTRLHFAKTSETNIPFSIFSLNRTDSTFNIFLNYSGNLGVIGEPVRDDFFLFSAETKKPFLIYINGYFDRGAQGHKRRVYVELVYYIEYSGEQETQSVGRTAPEHKVKITIDTATVIDLRRLFY